MALGVEVQQCYPYLGQKESYELSREQTDNSIVPITYNKISVLSLCSVSHFQSDHTSERKPSNSILVLLRLV